MSFLIQLYFHKGRNCTSQLKILPYKLEQKIVNISIIYHMLSCLLVLINKTQQNILNLLCLQESLQSQQEFDLLLEQESNFWISSYCTLVIPNDLQFWLVRNLCVVSKMFCHSFRMPEEIGTILLCCQDGNVHQHETVMPDFVKQLYTRTYELSTHFRNYIGQYKPMIFFVLLTPTLSCPLVMAFFIRVISEVHYHIVSFYSAEDSNLIYD